MSSTVQIDLGATIQGILDGTTGRNARLALAEAVGSDSNTIVPRDTGSLRASMFITDDGVEWRQSYAKAVYYRDDEETAWSTAGTHSHWVEHAANDHMDDWGLTVAQQIAKGLA